MNSRLAAAWRNTLEGRQVSLAGDSRRRRRQQGQGSYHRRGTECCSRGRTVLHLYVYVCNTLIRDRNCRFNRLVHGNCRPWISLGFSYPPRTKERNDTPPLPLFCPFIISHAHPRPPSDSRLHWTRGGRLNLSRGLQAGTHGERPPLESRRGGGGSSVSWTGKRAAWRSRTRSQSEAPQIASSRRRSMIPSGGDDHHPTVIRPAAGLCTTLDRPRFVSGTSTPSGGRCFSSSACYTNWYADESSTVCWVDLLSRVATRLYDIGSCLSKPAVAPALPGPCLGKPACTPPLGALLPSGHYSSIPLGRSTSFLVPRSPSYKSRPPLLLPPASSSFCDPGIPENTIHRGLPSRPPVSLLHSQDPHVWLDLRLREVRYQSRIRAFRAAPVRQKQPEPRGSHQQESLLVHSHHNGWRQRRDPWQVSLFCSPPPKSHHPHLWGKTKRKRNPKIDTPSQQVRL